MDICWTVLTDGRRKYIEECLPAWVDWLDELIDNKFIIDDSGDKEYREWLSKTFPSFTIVPVGSERMGYNHAMSKIFDVVKTSKKEYCLHIEDDFILKRRFDIESSIKILKENNSLSQISFIREPWYHNEVESGGLIEAIERDNKGINFIQKETGGIPWIEHTAYWTCNPNIFPSWLTEFDWPSGEWSESRFGRKIFSKGKKAGIFGLRKDAPYVEHIGRERYGTKY